MKAAIVEKIGDNFKTIDIEISQPIGKEVLVSVKASGLCHSDDHIRTKGLGKSFPAILGHELSGIVEAVGSDVSDFKVGDHVVGCLIQFCGHCVNCTSGKTTLCTNPDDILRKENEPDRLYLKDKSERIYQTYGLGGFAEKALVHQNQLAKIPNEMPFDKACLLGCGTVTGAGAIINSANIRPGDSVAIIGTGGVGLNAISGAKIAGATTIIAIDIDDEKLEFAKRFGATHTINSTKEDPVTKAKELTEDDLRASFDMVGMAVTTNNALKMVKNGGTAYVIGMSKPDTIVPLESFTDILSSVKRIEGIMMGSSNTKRDIPMYAKLYLQGRMNLDDLVYQKITLDEISEAYDLLNSGKVMGRSVISFE